MDDKLAAVYRYYFISQFPWTLQESTMQKLSIGQRKRPASNHNSTEEDDRRSADIFPDEFIVGVLEPTHRSVVLEGS
ncbi:hypothetical protein HBH56_016800 [Parastagonospora nodorum]|uniref:Uncharacterized protein n=1 Tax=Phaeosphaeria nodorum (strain SN15 / ATCC MYA-4574 / FGSC 10173) TaxID=321614 RepID=Q0UZF6_PHANO|nr:hypothetical protein SNOG_02858 [Parastagonospora nodorum SN15]KAH3919631.1 hypothetical protein HBH56_016800 [Parastagonospora nodorum]EAT89589.1 hypothetical protein SNOG_02858 [Parastagonospora nodorum SN15]KAH3937207.1 hypothetical protein HBH54_017670 [Parastagonospora nodorum]KAH3953556.1 hypothetical protein HBH53_030040 [Parastagonospora nodorum]KAH3969265.1 hypothetical protein HBH51_122190 [Parastagonospora nodorum]